MYDLAKLGLEVRSDGVVVATNRLDSMDRSAKRVDTSADRLNKRMENVGRTLARVAVVGGAALAGMTANSLRLAIAAEETAAKFQVVFRGSVERTDHALRDLQKTIPLTTSEIRGFAAAAQDMLVPLGIARDQAADMSVEIVKLAGDIGSFNNVSTDQVLQNIQSALAGEAQVLRKYGIALSEARLKQIAFEEGLTDSVKEMNASARAQATLIAITRDSADAMGDAARTADSTANQIRFLTRDFKEAQEQLGTALIPAFNDLLSIINKTGDDGLTPFQRLLNAVSISIIDAVIALTELRLEVTQFVEQSKFVDFLSDVADEFERIKNLAEAITGLDLSEIFEFSMFPVPGLGATGQNLGAAARGPLGFGSVDPNGGGGGWGGEDIPEEADEASERVQHLRDLLKQLRNSRDDILKGVVTPLEDAESAAADVAKTVQGRVIPALQQMNQGIADELAANMAYIDEVGFNQMADAMQAEIDALAGGAEAWREYERAMFQAQKVAELGPDATQEQIEKIHELAGALYDLRNPVEELSTTLEDVGFGMEAIGSAFGDVIRQIQLGVERGTDEYKKLEVAANAANVMAAIGAVLNQGFGDPYSAFVRMAAMAASVASLGYSVGNLSGYSDPTEDRQAANGTGSVLGDAEAKTESIVNSLKIVADATTELVGINRGMLRALQDLNSAITGATTMLARGAGDVDFGAIPDATGFFEGLTGISNPFVPFLDSLLGGSVKIADTGLRIEGGTLAELIEGVLISAYQDLAVKDHLFSGTDIERSLVALDQDIQDQFGDIFRALVNTVMEAGMAIGWSAEYIQGQLDNFRTWAQDISLEDMSAEEQQQALQEFFGKVFDDIAAWTIPGISALQKLGEGAGETLVRVATSVQVFELALEQLGFQFMEFGEQFPWWTMDDFIYRTTIWKVELVELLGGIENFIDGFTTFFEAFASDEQKFNYLLNSITARFEELGLVLPETRDGIWDLMQSFDATTEAGREGIALLLQLAPALDQYFSMLEESIDKAARAAQAALETVQGFVGTGLPSELVSLRQRFLEALKAADALGATQAEYAMIVRKFDRDLSVLVAQWTRNIILLSQDLFSEDNAQDAIDNIENVRRVSNSLFTDWERALEDLKRYADGLLLDENLTTLSPAQQLAEAERQFRDILARARSGDVDAAGALPGAAQAFLEEARFMFASGGQYQRIFNEVQRALRGIEMPAGIEEWTYEIAENTARTATAVEAMQNDTLMEIERYLQAMDLATSLGQLANALGEPVEDLALRLGVPLDRLQDILGTDIDALAQTGFREVDLLTSINEHLFNIEQHFRSANYGGERGAKMPDDTRIPRNPDDSRLTSQEDRATMGEVKALLTDIRDTLDRKERDDRDNNREVLTALNQTNEVLRRAS